MDAKKKILIIEDEKKISQVLEINLMMAGYVCDTAYDGEEGLNKAREGNFDLILLDIMLPKMDGFTVCREIRKTLATPIIMVTAREDEIDKITGLDLGADDYVTKPFSLKVLLARVKANIRRFSGEVVETKTEIPEGEVIVINELTIDLKKFTAFKSGSEIELTRKEYEVLLFLAAHRGEIFSREALLENVWGYEGFFGDMRTVDVTISRLRTKIEDDPADPKYILTKRTKGYFIA
ncbi:MAG: response regulator transcription factor [Clostridia bacterium]|nr:response regulator transcription factor [Clostridia bacterium]MBO4428942.1 response regulator transcription factor [Clostridia bacterium]